MPQSEAYLADPGPLVRMRFPTFTGHVGGFGAEGVSFVAGEAQNGCSAACATRLAGIFGRSIERVGPWAPEPVVVELPPEERATVTLTLTADELADLLEPKAEALAADAPVAAVVTKRTRRPKATPPPDAAG